MRTSAPGAGRVTAAAMSCDRAETLRALRDKLAESIDSTSSARDVAALSNRLLDVLDALAAFGERADETPLDELHRRRSARTGRTTKPSVD